MVLCYGWAFTMCSKTGLEYLLTMAGLVATVQIFPGRGNTWRPQQPERGRVLHASNTDDHSREQRSEGGSDGLPEPVASPEGHSREQRPEGGAAVPLPIQRFPIADIFSFFLCFACGVVGYVIRCGDRCSVHGKKRFGRGPRRASDDRWREHASGLKRTR